MGKVSMGLTMSLEPGWTFPFESEDRDQYKFDELAVADVLTY